jgi:hypothetical protein
MHVSDAGDSSQLSANGRVKPMCTMRCTRCGTETGWLVFDSVTEAKQGIP